MRVVSELTEVLGRNFEVDGTVGVQGVKGLCLQVQVVLLDLRYAVEEVVGGGSAIAGTHLAELCPLFLQL